MQVYKSDTPDVFNRVNRLNETLEWNDKGIIAIVGTLHTECIGNCIWIIVQYMYIVSCIFNCLFVAFLTIVINFSLLFFNFKFRWSRIFGCIQVTLLITIVLIKECIVLPILREFEFIQCWYYTSISRV